MKTPKHMSRRALLAVGLAALFTLQLSACARDYVTGRPSFTMVDEATELRIGAQEDENVVAMFGIYDDESLNAHVNDLGQAIAKVSHRPNLIYTFKILDTPVVNAFALPGGYVYVTRGLLAHINSTDELVGVLAHEVGHVAGRHSAEQISKQIVASGFGLLPAISRVAPRLGGLLSAPSALLLLSHSRKQEEESDELGVEYATRLGYDARELARFLNLLNAISQEDGQQLPTFLSTHPDSGERADEVTALSNEWQTELDWTAKPVDSASYLTRIDGLVVGENPRQGFAKEGTFYHPDMGFEFPYRDDWTLMNTPTAVSIINPKGDALILLSGVPDDSPSEAAERMIASGGFVVQDRRSGDSSGLESVTLTAVTDDQELQLIARFFQLDDAVIAILGVTLREQFVRYSPDFAHTLDQFGRTKDPAILSIQPARLRIQKARTTTTLRALLKSSKIPDDLHQTIAQLNGKSLDATVRRSEAVKLIEPSR